MLMMKKMRMYQKRRSPNKSNFSTQKGKQMGKTKTKRTKRRSR